jgi:hypothetical protein
MYVDHNLLYSEDQAITADATSTNVVKHDNIGIGRGEKMSLVLQVTQAFNTLTNLIVSLQADSVVTMDDTVQTVLSKTILLADLTLGAQFVLGEAEVVNPQTDKFSNIKYDVTGSNPTTGKVNCFWTKDVQNIKNPVNKGLTSGYPTY